MPGSPFSTPTRVRAQSATDPSHKKPRTVVIHLCATAPRTARASRPIVVRHGLLRCCLQLHMVRSEQIAGCMPNRREGELIIHLGLKLCELCLSQTRLCVEHKEVGFRAQFEFPLVSRERLP